MMLKELNQLKTDQTALSFSKRLIKGMARRNDATILRVKVFTRTANQIPAEV